MCLFVCFLLVLVIMVQNPKGGGLSSSFGGSGAQQMGGVQKTTDFLDKSTWILGAALLILILLSNIALDNGGNNFESKLLESDKTEKLILEDNIPEAIIPETND